MTTLAELEEAVGRCARHLSVRNLTAAFHGTPGGDPAVVAALRGEGDLPATGFEAILAAGARRAVERFCGERTETELEEIINQEGV